MIILRGASSNWLCASEASKKLGFSENSLKCWRECGYLKAGKHWMKKDPGSLGLVFYNIDLCAKEMNEWWGRDAMAGP